MSDLDEQALPLVERLRAVPVWMRDTCGQIPRLCLEAAAEIERLQASVMTEDCDFEICAVGDWIAGRVTPLNAKAAEWLSNPTTWFPYNEVGKAKNELENKGFSVRVLSLRSADAYSVSP
jgi:hypothetical protein